MNPHYFDGRCAYCGKDETICAENCEGETMKPKCTNIVRVGNKVYVTIRYPDTDDYYGYDAIYEGNIEDVMLE